jgi:hypothetical protein
MKVWINFPFLFQPGKFRFLESAIWAVNKWQVEKTKIVVFMNKTDQDTSWFVDHMLKAGVHEIKVVDVTEKPLLLQWAHKKYLPEFLESEYTHFIYADGDIEIRKEVFSYWLKTREFLNQNNYNRYIPGTFRIETYNDIDKASDLTHRTDIHKMPVVNIKGKWFFRPQEPFQGISIMDKELAFEHYNSKYFTPMMDDSDYKFGFGETCISGYVLHNVPEDAPEGYKHRVLIPLDDYKDCWVYHLPANYAANPNSEHGKIPADYVFSQVQARINWMKTQEAKR